MADNVHGECLKAKQQHLDDAAKDQTINMQNFETNCKHAVLTSPDDLDKDASNLTEDLTKNEHIDRLPVIVSHHGTEKASCYNQMPIWYWRSTSSTNCKVP